MSEDHHEHENEHEEGEAANASHTEETTDHQPKTEDSKAAAAPAEFVSLKVVSQDGSEVFFKIKKHTPLRKLVDAYCQRQGQSTSAIRFLYDGRRIQPDQTPKDLGMEDGDIIDAMLQQTGGY